MIHKKKLTPSEIAVLKYLAQNESTSTSNLRGRKGPASDLSFLANKGLVERFKEKSKRANKMVDRYRITDTGRKFLTDLASDIETEFDAWQDSKSEIKFKLK